MLAPTELAEAELTQRFAVLAGIGSLAEARREDKLLIGGPKQAFGTRDERRGEISERRRGSWLSFNL